MAITFAEAHCADARASERAAVVPGTDKSKDPRYPWFVKNYGKRCWELDAMDPNDLRACVRREIKN